MSINDSINSIDFLPLISGSNEFASIRHQWKRCALTQTDLRDIDNALADIYVQVARHPEHLQKWLDGESVQV